MNKNTQLTLEDKEKIDGLESFLKEAFCISGECKFTSFTTCIISGKKMPFSMQFKLTDNKRGVFYITITKE